MCLNSIVKFRRESVNSCISLIQLVKSSLESGKSSNISGLQ